MKTIVSMGVVDAVKADLTRTLPSVKSSHRVEAMARGLGWNSNAHLRAELGDGSTRLGEVSDKAFAAYLDQHGFTGITETALSDAVIRSAIRVQLEADPTLTRSGFRGLWDPHYEEARDRLLSSDSVLDEFRRAVEFLGMFTMRKTLNRKSTSYGWKHRVEHHFSDQGGNPYVANGTFIAAARHLGFTTKRIDDTPNAWLNIGDRIGTPKVPRGTKMTASYIGGKSRLTAWRNLMVSGINAGLEQGLFGLEPDDNRWTGDSVVYRFQFLGMPAIAYARDIGFGELSIHVAVNPAKDAEQAIAANNAGFYAGDAFASGWLERKNGRWLQAGKKTTNSFRRDLLPVIAAASVDPKGYEDHGKTMM